MALRAVLRLAAAAALVGLPAVHAFVAGGGSGLVARPTTIHGRAGIRMSDDKYGETRTQVITDIDDTVKSSGGLRLLGKLGVNIGPALGGLDTQYKRNDFYPGVFQFGSELAAYGLPPNMQPAPMAVLTARARELKVFLALKPKTKLVQKYREAAEKLFSEYGKSAPSWGIDTEKTVLYGSVVEWILQAKNL
jgi:thymidylate synthase ThyX